MSRVKGEGRSPAEKSGRVIGRDAVRKAEDEKLDARYNDLCGPVEVRKIPKEEDEGNET